MTTKLKPGSIPFEPLHPSLPARWGRVEAALLLSLQLGLGLMPL